MEEDPELLKATGFDEAILGITCVRGTNVVAYDYEKCVDILKEQDELTEEEAIEHMEFNVVGSYVGERTPVLIWKADG